MKLIGMIKDDPTPKIDVGETAYTMRSRDYKGVMAIVISKEDGTADGEDVRRILRPGCIHGHVYNRGGMEDENNSQKIDANGMRETPRLS